MTEPGDLCTCGKKCYDSRRQARAGIRAFRHRMRAYLCHESNKWHLTRVTKKSLRVGIAYGHDS